MKLLILILPSLAFANFISKSDIGKLPATVFFKKDKCESVKGETCYRLPADYNWQFYSLSSGSIKEDATKKSQYDVAATERAQKKERQESLDFTKLTEAQKNKLLKRFFKEYVERENIDPSEL